MGLILAEGDVHLIFDDTNNVCKVWRRQAQSGLFLWACEMQNAAVESGFGHYGWCPRGEFLVGAPSDCRLIPFGYHFTPLFDVDPQGPMHENGRGGIGIHGGGSGLRDPFLPRQGWQRTHGCLRVQNEDNARLVLLIRMTQAKKSRVYCRVGGQAG
jgi:hypothetical protein